MHERTTDQGKEWKDKKIWLWVYLDFFFLGENPTHATTTHLIGST